MDNYFDAQNTPEEATTPTEAETQTADEREATTPSADDTDASGEPDSNGTADQEPEQPFLTVRYNKEDKGLTADEARAWAQKGMRYEQSYNALFRAAAARGQNPEDFLAAMDKQERDKYEADLRDRYGDDDEVVDKLMRLYDTERDDRVKSAEQEAANRETEARATTEQRIADEFVQLQKEFPEIKAFSDLPKSVVQAASEGMPLAYAFLLNQHFESKKRMESEKAAQEASKASTGAVEQTDESNSGGMDAFQRAFWSS